MQRSTTTYNGTTKLEPLKKTRTNSAQANLQSHPCFQSSLFSDAERAAGSIKVWHERHPEFDKTHQTGQESSKKIFKDHQLESIIWAQSVRQPRRLTLTNVNNITEWEIVMLKRQKSYAQAALGELKGKLEEKMTLDGLNELNKAFLQADSDGSGTLELEEFKKVVRNALKIKGRNDEEIESLFMKINFSSDGKITWDQFCTFMQLNFNEKEETIRRQREVVFVTPARTENNPHRCGIQRVCCTSDGNFMVMSLDGVVSFWSSFGDLKRVKRDIVEKRVVVKDKGDKQDTKRLHPKWITDFLIMNELNKIVMGTGDRELQFWELSSFEPYCQIFSLPTVPIKMAYCFNGKDDITLAYGDTDGCVNILLFDAVGETLRVWKSSVLIIAQMPSVNLDKALEKVKLVRWKAHDDWVEQLVIDKRLNQIISCSNDENHAVIIGCIQQTTDVNTLTNQTTTSTTGGATVATTTITITNASESTIPINQATKSTTTNMTATTTSDERRLMRRAKTAHSRPQADHNQYTHAISMSSRDVRRRPETNETVFKVNKGVKVFDFSFEKNLLVTGG